MNVVFSIGHPAHVHLFKNAIKSLRTDGHNVKVFARDKDIAISLLKAEEIEYEQISAKNNGLLDLPVNMCTTYWNGYKSLRGFDPDVFVARFNPAIAHLSTLFGAKFLLFELNEKGNWLTDITIPFTDRVCTPRSFTQDRGEKHIRYDGFHELAYLHPAWFTPDENVLRESGVDIEDDFFVLRFVTWDAYHDVGKTGLTFKQKQDLIDFLSTKGRVFVSTESGNSFNNSEPIPTDPHEVHHLLAYAKLYVGESGTMPIEASVLGTPAVCINPNIEEWGIFDELVNEYRLIQYIDSTQDPINHQVLIKWANQTGYQQKRNKLISDKIDLTEFMLENIKDLADPDSQK